MLLVVQLRALRRVTLYGVAAVLPGAIANFAPASQKAAALQSKFCRPACIDLHFAWLVISTDQIGISAVQR